jgi:hydroxyacylglutathione hydrolase
MLFRQYFDPKLAQYAYLVGCQKSGEALIIDPRAGHRPLRGGRRVRGPPDHRRGRDPHPRRLPFGRPGVRRALRHAHLPLGRGRRGVVLDWARTGRVRRRLPEARGHLPGGGDRGQAVHTPGHTPEHLSYVLVDRGSGLHPHRDRHRGLRLRGGPGAPRPPRAGGGDARGSGALGAAALLEPPPLQELPDYAQVWPAHGAGSTCGKALGAVPQTTVGYEKLYNASLSGGGGPG